jgi:hypothetical protein
VAAPCSDPEHAGKSADVCAWSGTESSATSFAGESPSDGPQCSAASPRDGRKLLLRVEYPVSGKKVRLAPFPSFRVAAKASPAFHCAKWQSGKVARADQTGALRSRDICASETAAVSRSSSQCGNHRSQGKLRRSQDAGGDPRSRKELAPKDTRDDISRRKEDPRFKCLRMSS